MSSDILSAYNKFRTIEKKAEVEKQKRLEVQVRSKYDVEITDASDFNQTVAKLDSPLGKQ